MTIGELKEWIERARLSDDAEVLLEVDSRDNIDRVEVEVTNAKAIISTNGVEALVFQHA